MKFSYKCFVDWVSVAPWWLCCCLLAGPLLIVASAANALAEGGLACDDQAATPGSDGYTKRDDNRCEGMYRQKVGSHFAPHSFTRGVVPVAKTGSISVSWMRGAAHGPVSLVANSYECSPPYQMRASIPEGSYVFAWPAGLAARNKVERLAVRARLSDFYVEAFAGAKPSTDPYNIVFCSSGDVNGATFWLFDPNEKEVVKRAVTADKGPITEAVAPELFAVTGIYKAMLQYGNSSTSFELMVVR